MIFYFNRKKLDMIVHNFYRGPLYQLLVSNLFSLYVTSFVENTKQEIKMKHVQLQIVQI